jgi:hypothetical protein
MGAMSRLRRRVVSDLPENMGNVVPSPKTLLIRKAAQEFGSEQVTSAPPAEKTG